jgi:NADPH:quinone reductase
VRAAWYDRQGPAAEVLQVGELPAPEPARRRGAGGDRVSAVNPSDAKARTGSRGPMAFPRIVPPFDGAGVVDAVGPGVPDARVGERVWVTRPSGSGTPQPRRLVASSPGERAVPLPTGISFAEGACLGIPAMTAHGCLFADGPVAGCTVLVSGRAGRVGF